MSLRKNYSLLHNNTFQLDVEAEKVIIIENEQNVASFFKENKGEPFQIIGGGSNILLVTNPLKGITLLNEIKGIRTVKEDEQHIWVEFGSGENWHQMVLWCLDNNYYGIENLSLIPGTVGAAPIQNIGAYGVEVKSVIENVRYFDIEKELFCSLNNSDCQFDYRDSIFKNALKGKFFITNVQLKLSKTPNVSIRYGAIKEVLERENIVNPTPQQVSQAIIEIRQSKLPDPKKIGNCGSFFKNPIVNIALSEKIKADYPEMPSYPISDVLIKIPAGWLIEKSGWKGKNYKRTGVHTHQALVLVNRNNTIGEEVKELCSLIQKDVFQQFEIQLEPEVNIW